MNTDFSVLDANIARIKEGLRVLEDISRFSLKHEYSFTQLKIIRHTIVSLEHRIGVAGLIASRRGNDIGHKVVTDSEYVRQTVWSLIRANVGRVTQAFRVIEEFVKVYHKSIARDVEDLRYQIYGLEKVLLEQTPHFWMHKYFEEGIVYPISDNVQDLVWYVENGAKIIQLRDKYSSKHIVYAKAKQICHYLHEQRLSVGNTEPVLFILNDHIDLAAQLSVAGVHVGQDDMSISQSRWKLGSNVIIGRSNQTIEQLAESVDVGADYVSYGPIFATKTKPDREPVGTDQLADIIDRLETPFVAIGGINKKTADAVYDTGVRNVSVVGAGKEFFGD